MSFKMNYKPLLQNLILSFLSFIIFLFFLELIFQITYFLIQPKTEPPEAESFRILCIGDSSTYGLGASDSSIHSYPALLEKKLSKAFKTPFQVYNLGLPGINSSQALKRLKQFLPVIKPHMVITLVGINDPWNLEKSNQFNYYPFTGLSIIFKPFIKIYFNSKLRRFIKLLLLKDNIPNRFSNAEPIVSFSKSSQSFKDLIMPSPRAQRLALYLSLKHNFLEINNLCKSNHIPSVFLEYHAPGWQAPEFLISRIYREENLIFIPLESFFKNLSIKTKSKIRSEDNWHLNDMGYSILTDEIIKYISSKQLLPSSLKPN